MQPGSRNTEPASATLFKAAALPHGTPFNCRVAGHGHVGGEHIDEYARSMVPVENIPAGTTATAWYRPPSAADYRHGSKTGRSSAHVPPSSWLRRRRAPAHGTTAWHPCCLAPHPPHRRCPRSPQPHPAHALCGWQHGCQVRAQDGRETRAVASSSSAANRPRACSRMPGVCTQRRNRSGDPWPASYGTPVAVGTHQSGAQVPSRRWCWYPRRWRLRRRRRRRQHGGQEAATV